MADQQRTLIDRQDAAEARGRRLRRRWVLALGVVVAIAAVASVWGSDGDGSATTSPDDVFGDRRATLTDDAPVTVEAPQAYRITYRIDLVAGGDRIITTERVTVRRPFESRVETFTGPPPVDGPPASVSTSAFGSLSVRHDDATGGVTFATSPLAGSGDLVTRPVLAHALDQGLLVAGAHRVIAGRVCTEHRTGTSVLGGDLVAPGGADPEEWADVCIDGAGLVLEEVWTLGSAPVRHRVATSVEILDPDDLDDAVFAPVAEGTLSPVEGGGLVTPAVPDPFGEFWLDAAPDGLPALEVDVAGSAEPLRLDPVGAFVILPAGTGAGLDAQTLESLSITTAWVWARGSTFVTVELGQGRAAAPPRATPIALGELGEGALDVGLRQSQVHIDLEIGRFLQVSATLPPDAVVALARRLGPDPEDPTSLVLGSIDGSTDVRLTQPDVSGEAADDTTSDSAQEQA